MGTSKPYQAPTGPGWGAAKGFVSRQAGGGTPSAPEKQREALGRYISANGGAKGMARGGGGEGGGGSGGGAAQSAAGAIGAFFSGVELTGAEAALEQLGLSSLEGKSVAEVQLELADLLFGTPGTLEEVDARSAARLLLDEVLKDATDADDVAARLDAQMSSHNLESMIVRYFGFYLYQTFCRVFFERLVARVGEKKSDSYLKGILSYIKEEVRSLVPTMSFVKTDWSSTASRKVLDKILQNTLEVFSE